MEVNKIVEFGELEFPSKEYDDHAKAIIRLYLYGILTDSERHRAFERLMRKIERLDV